MSQNFCVIKANKFYQEIFDEIIDEELNVNKVEHQEEIKRIIEKIIMSSDKINIYENYTNEETFISTVLENIIDDYNNPNLQGETLLSFCDDNNTYEIVIIQDLSQTNISDEYLNEFASLSNIEFLPVYWNVGMIKTTYIDNNPKITTISKKDVANVFINLIYHTAVIVDTDGNMCEIVFTGDYPFSVIGPNFEHLNSFDILGFTMFPYVEKTKTDKLNEIASKIMGQEIYSRVCFVLLCPTTHKKYFNLTTKTIERIAKAIDNADIVYNIEKDSLNKEFSQNPFLLLKKYLCKN